MARIQELLSGKGGGIDYDRIKSDHPWITRRNQKCILSPDSDGLLCGLFMSHHLGWEIIGFYDGKVALIKEGCSVYDDDVCFLDIEIYRRGVKSVGHHMVSVYNRIKPADWDLRFAQCIQPNLIRGYDKNEFRLKYPLATIHLLIGLLENTIELEIKDSAIFPLLFTDGTYNVMFSYPENVMNWWDFMKVNDSSRMLNHIFLSEDYSVYKLMKEMDSFFRERDQISVPRERGDRLKISNRDSSPHNIEEIHGSYSIKREPANRCILFLNLLAKKTGWCYQPENWNFNGFNLFQFTKSDFKSRGWNVNMINYKSMLEENPLSWAMTSGDNVEFTIEHPDKLV